MLNMANLSAEEALDALASELRKKLHFPRVLRY